MFLFFGQSEPQRSYKHGSYSKKGVYVKLSVSFYMSNLHKCQIVDFSVHVNPTSMSHCRSHPTCQCYIKLLMWSCKSILHANVFLNQCQTAHVILHVIVILHQHQINDVHLTCQSYMLMSSYINVKSSMSFYMSMSAYIYVKLLTSILHANIFLKLNFQQVIGSGGKPFTCFCGKGK